MKEKTGCYDCGLKYTSDRWVEAVIPNKIWERITPNSNKGAGLLCISCMAVRLKGLGIDVVPIQIASIPFKLQNSVN